MGTNAHPRVLSCLPRTVGQLAIFLKSRLSCAKRTSFARTARPPVWTRMGTSGVRSVFTRGEVIIGSEDPLLLPYRAALKPAEGEHEPMNAQHLRLLAANKAFKLRCKTPSPRQFFPELNPYAGRKGKEPIPTLAEFMMKRQHAQRLQIHGAGERSNTACGCWKCTHGPLGGSLEECVEDAQKRSRPGIRRTCHLYDPMFSQRGQRA